MSAHCLIRAIDWRARRVYAVTRVRQFIIVVRVVCECVFFTYAFWVCVETDGLGQRVYSYKESFLLHMCVCVRVCTYAGLCVPSLLKSKKS